MNAKKVFGYLLIAVPIVTGVVLGTVFYGSAFAKAVGVAVAFVAPILVGCWLLGKK